MVQQVRIGGCHATDACYCCCCSLALSFVALLLLLQLFCFAVRLSCQVGWLGELTWAGRVDLSTAIIEAM
jgi:hypothetical protein